MIDFVKKDMTILRKEEDLLKREEKRKGKILDLSLRVFFLHTNPTACSLFAYCNIMNNFNRL